LKEITEVEVMRRPMTIGGDGIGEVDSLKYLGGGCSGEKCQSCYAMREFQ